MSSPTPAVEVNRGDELRAAWVASHLNEFGEIHRLERLSGGASRETWLVEIASGGPGSESMILQIRQPGTNDDGLDVRTEARLVSAAASAGVPVPHLHAWDEDPSVFGKPFLLFERVTGEALPQRILREGQFAAARTRLAFDYGHALGRIQSIPDASSLGLRRRDPLADVQRLLDEDSRPHPVLEYGLRWLQRNDSRETSAHQVVVHGDYRSGNGIVDPTGLRAMIDWEFAHVGDPMEDLGWMCSRAWRFGAPLPVGGFGTRNQLLAGYKETAARAVDLQSLHWWEVMASMRWASMTIKLGGHSAERPSLEVSAIRRRVCEAEYDMLLLLKDLP